MSTTSVGPHLASKAAPRLRTLRRALDPAIRAHGGRAVQTGDQGAGLGLTLSYEIVVNSTAGNVDSQLDIVTEFVVTLPRTMAANDGVRT